jgi:DNA-binding CsgD family transcriptional regulator
MSGLLRRLSQLFGKKERGQNTRTFSLDNRLDLTLREIARDQHRDQTEVLNEILRAGAVELLRADEIAASWNSLSPREQEVAALTCLGYSSFEIAESLTISYDTVRSHSKNVYRKFNLNRKELRKALRDWHFAEWWENHQQVA